MSRPPDPRKAHRRGATPFGDDTGYDVANDAPAKPKRGKLSGVLGRKPAQLPHTGCHLYQAPASPHWFPGLDAVYTRCPRHQPAASIDLGPVPGHCIECEVEAQHGR